jgi:hypothetical protein
VPAFLGILLLGADASTSFTRQSALWNASYDTARIVARHALDAAAGEAYARARMRMGDYVPEVRVTVDAAAQLVTVEVRAAPERMAPFGILALALGDRVSVRVSQALEPI